MGFAYTDGRAQVNDLCGAFAETLSGLEAELFQVCVVEQQRTVSRSITSKYHINSMQAHRIVKQVGLRFRNYLMAQGVTSSADVF